MVEGEEILTTDRLFPLILARLQLFAYSLTVYNLHVWLLRAE